MFTQKIECQLKLSISIEPIKGRVLHQVPRPVPRPVRKIQTLSVGVFQKQHAG